MLNALKMEVCLNSAVSFDMYSQQLTLPSQKPAKAVFLVFVFKICLRHQSVTPFLVMQPLLRKILDPPLHLLPAYSSMTLNTFLNNLILWLVRYLSCF